MSSLRAIEHYFRIVSGRSNPAKGGAINVFVMGGSTVLLQELQPLRLSIPDVKVVGHAVDESVAIEHVNALRPDVVPPMLLMLSKLVA